jgi:hypothetical protein
MALILSRKSWMRSNGAEVRHTSSFDIEQYHCDPDAEVDVDSDLPGEVVDEQRYGNNNNNKNNNNKKKHPSQTPGIGKNIPSVEYEKQVARVKRCLTRAQQVFIVTELKCIIELASL